jgi:hypothetical protein
MMVGAKEGGGDGRLTSLVGEPDLCLYVDRRRDFLGDPDQTLSLHRRTNRVTAVPSRTSGLLEIREKGLLLAVPNATRTQARQSRPNMSVSFSWSPNV